MTSVDAVAQRHELLRVAHPDVLGGHALNQVAIIGDAEYLATAGGQIAWALTVNLTARLYKGLRRIRLVLDPTLPRLEKAYFPNAQTTLLTASLAMLDQLNPQGYYLADAGERPTGTDWVVIGVGRPPAEGQLAVAGRGWHAFVDHDGWRDWTDDGNPIGPMLAACLGVAQLYQRLYPMQDAPPPRPIVLSGFDHRGALEPGPSMKKAISVGPVDLAGAGALGMATLLALASLPQVDLSDVIVVDHDDLEDSNLNRCILAVLDDESSLKVEVVARELARLGAPPEVFPGRWLEFVAAEVGRERPRERVVSCVDRYEAREEVQHHLPPRVLFSGGTGDFAVSASRHRLDDEFACGTCFQARNPQRCATPSDGATQMFAAPPDPSIGFVSVMGGVLLAAELLKDLVAGWAEGQVRCAVRAYPLIGTARRRDIGKDAGCGCTNRFVIKAYQEYWPRR